MDSFETLIRFLGVVMVAATLSGCGGDDEQAPGLAPGGYHERFFVENPDATLNLTHTGVLHLEAAGGHEGDSHTEDGVDVLPYSFPPATELTFALAPEFEGGLRLVDADGVEMLRLDATNRDETVVVEGRYDLEVRHPHAGDATAEPLTVFVQPVAESDATAGADAAGGGAGMADPNAVTTVRAGHDCIGCNLRGVSLFTNKIGKANLTLADFTRAQFFGTEFNQTTLVGTIFDDATMNLSLFNNVVANRASFKRVKFVSGSRFQNIGQITPGVLTQADFTDAMFMSGCLEVTNLSGAIFSGAVFEKEFVVGGSNFSGSDLTTAQFLGTDVKRVSTACGFLDPSPALFRGAILSTETAGVIFQDVDLSGIDFSDTSLRRATLTGSNLAGAVFTDTDLSGTSFAGVDLSQTDLSGAILSGTTSFVGATLSDGVLHGVNLSGQSFPTQTTQFKGANLAHAVLDGTSLTSADLEDANLNGAQLIGANLNFVNLSGATLVGAHLGVAPGSGQQATRLHGAFMTDVDLTDADLRSADLSAAHLYGDATTTLLVRTQLDSANFDGALCSGAIFSGTLTDAVFNNAQLVNTIFNGATLTNAKFDSAYLQGADFSAASAVTGVTLSNAAVATMPGTWMYMEQDGTPFTFQYDATKLGALATNTGVTCPSGESGPCVGAKLTPVANGPFPPQPACVPKPPRYDNCLPPTAP